MSLIHGLSLESESNACCYQMCPITLITYSFLYPLLISIFSYRAILHAKSLYKDVSKYLITWNSIILLEQNICEVCTNPLLASPTQHIMFLSLVLKQHMPCLPSPPRKKWRLLLRKHFCHLLARRWTLLTVSSHQRFPVSISLPLINKAAFWKAGKTSFPPKGPKVQLIRSIVQNAICKLMLQIPVSLLNYTVHKWAMDSPAEPDLLQ